MAVENKMTALRLIMVNKVILPILWTFLPYFYNVWRVLQWWLLMLSDYGFLFRKWIWLNSAFNEVRCAFVSLLQDYYWATSVITAEAERFHLRGGQEALIAVLGFSLRSKVWRGNSQVERGYHKIEGAFVSICLPIPIAPSITYSRIVIKHTFTV